MIRRKPIRVANSKRAPARAVAVCLACEHSPIDPTFTTSYRRNRLAQTSETRSAPGPLLPGSRLTRGKNLQNPILIA